MICSSNQGCHSKLDSSGMHFVLDANIVIAEKFGSSVRFKALLSASTAAGYVVCIPTLVLEEVSAKYSRELKSVVHKIEGSFTRFSGRLDRDMKELVGGIEFEKESKCSQDRLLARLSTTESIILAYPRTPHVDLVKKATSRKKTI